MGRSCRSSTAAPGGAPPARQGSFSERPPGRPCADGREALLGRDAAAMLREEQAALVLHEAILLQSSVDYPKSAAAWRTYQRYHRFCHLSHYAAWGLLFLSVFETPLWCREGGLWTWMTPAERCGQTIPEDELFLSGLPMLPVGVGSVLEFILLGAILWKTLMIGRLHEFFQEAGGGDYLTTSRGLKCDYLMIGLGLCDAAVYGIFPGVPVRAAPFVRFGLAASLPRVKRIVASFCSVLAAIRAVGVFLAGVILIFAVIAAMVLDDSSEVNRYGDPVNTGFESFSDSIYTSFVAMTTASLPDVVITTYVHSRAMFWLWWLPFLLLGACLFTQVVLATVYQQYDEDHSGRLKESFRKRDEGIVIAFEVMKDSRCSDGSPGVSLAAFTALVEKMRRLSLNIAITPDVLEASFKASGSATPQVINSFEFYQMVNLLQHKFKTTRRDSPVRRRWGHTALGRVLVRLMDNGAEGPDLGYAVRYPGSVCDRCVRVILGANTFWVVLQCFYDLNDLPEPPWFHNGDTFFSFVYLGEVGLKLSHWSFAHYWLYADNRFDFITTVLLAGVGLAFLFLNLNKAILQYANMVRLMRIVRLLKALKNIPSCRMQVDVISKMMSTCWDVVLMNILVIYLWSAAGIQFFGGELYASNPKLKGQDSLSYFTSHYEIYNFNDLPMGIVTLFFCTLGSWNDNLASACMALYKRFTVRWFLAGAFHLSFYIASPVLAFNVYTAFSIDVFSHLKLCSQEVESQEIAIVRNLKRFLSAEMATRGECLQIEETADFRRMKVRRYMISSETGEEDWTAHEAATTRVASNRQLLVGVEDSDGEKRPQDPPAGAAAGASSGEAAAGGAPRPPDPPAGAAAGADAGEAAAGGVPRPPDPPADAAGAGEDVDGEVPRSWLLGLAETVGLSCTAREGKLLTEPPAAHP